MKNSLALLSFFAFAAASLAVSACVDESFLDEDIDETSVALTYDGHDYLFVRTPKPWAEAQTRCRLEGYDLVTVDSAAEESWLSSRQGLHGGGEWWIGYNDIGIEGTWLWSSNATGNYTNWYSGEPNNVNNEDCAFANWAGTRQWADAKCDRSVKFICESNSVPNINNGYFTYDGSNTNSAQQNTRDYPIYLYQGMLLTVGTCGVPGASFDPYPNDDTYLRIKNPSGQEIAFNDDACALDSSLFGPGSNLSIVAPVSGTYIVRAGCYASKSCRGTVAFTF